MQSEKIGNYFEDKRKGGKTNTKKIYNSFVVLEDGRLAEEIVNPDPGFAIYNPATNIVEYRPTVQVGDKYIYPLDGDLVRKNVILFPEKPQEYKDLESLRQEIASFIHKYVDLHPFYETLATYYILLTWLFDKNTVITYLGIFGEYGSGKTRAALTIGSVCYKPAFVSGALTCAPIYRLMEQARGTLVINEFEFDNSDMGIEMIKILNNGYEKGLKVLRIKDHSGVVEAFDAFGPKIFTYRQKKKDQAFESRLVTILIEETKRDDIPIVLPLEYEREATALRNKLLMFRFKNFNKVAHIDLSIFEGMERRLRQTLYPLLTVIDDGVFIKSIAKFVLNFQDQQRTERGMSWVAEYIQIIVDLGSNGEEVTLKSLSDKYNEGKSDRERITPRKAGSAVRTELKLKTHRVTSGENKGQFVIEVDVEKVNDLCVRYGIEIPEQSSLHSPSSPQPQPESEQGELGEVISDIEESPKSCNVCGGAEFWERFDGVKICNTCHPSPDNTQIIEAEEA